MLWPCIPQKKDADTIYSLRLRSPNNFYRVEKFVAGFRVQYFIHNGFVWTLIRHSFVFYFRFICFILYVIKNRIFFSLFIETYLVTTTELDYSSIFIQTKVEKLLWTIGLGFDAHYLSYDTGIVIVGSKPTANQG